MGRCRGSLPALVTAALETAAETEDIGDSARLLYAALDASYNSGSLGGRTIENCRELSERVIGRFLENRRCYEGDEDAECSVFRLIVLSLYGVEGLDGEELHPEWRAFSDLLLERWSGEALGAVLWQGLADAQKLRRHTAMTMDAYMLGDDRYAALLERSYAALVGEVLLPFPEDHVEGMDFCCLSALYDAALDGTDGLMPDMAVMDGAASLADGLVLGGVLRGGVSGLDALGDTGSVSFGKWDRNTLEALSVSVRHCCWRLSREADDRFDGSF